MKTYSKEATDWAEQTLASMTLEEKIGQMLIADFPAVFTNRQHENLQRIKKIIQECHIGGVILAGGSLLDIAVLTNELQKTTTIPLLVNADIEKGCTFSHLWKRHKGRTPDLPEKLTGGGTDFPCLMAIGATRNEEYAYRAGRITALEARAIGIHWTNAPVLDVNVNPRNPIINTRSFGEDLQLAAKLGVAYVQGCQSAGVIATVKHFPGHGDTAQDTHMELPSLPFDRVRLQQVELVPFKAAIDAGVKAVMTAHIALPEIDPTKRPSTLSTFVIQDLLRKELGFQGLAVTDAMTMQAISDHFGVEESAVLAVKAGIDMLLMPKDCYRTHRRLVSAVQDKEIPLETIHAAVHRILAAKADLNLHHHSRVSLDAILDTVNTPAAQTLAEKTAADAITLLEHNDSILPLRTESIQKPLGIIISNSPQPNDGEELTSRLQKIIPNYETCRLDNNVSEKILTTIKDKMADCDLLMLQIFLSVGGWQGELSLPSQVHGIIQIAQDLKKPVVVISLGDPYLLQFLPSVTVSICAYSSDSLMEKAVSKALIGETPFRGRLPVSIPGRFEYGDGIQS